MLLIRSDTRVGARLAIEPYAPNALVLTQNAARARTNSTVVIAAGLLSGLSMLSGMLAAVDAWPAGRRMRMLRAAIARGPVQVQTQLQQYVRSGYR